NIRIPIRESLTREGMKVCEVSEVEVAQDKIRSCAPDLLILNMPLPKLSRLELCRWVLRRTLEAMKDLPRLGVLHEVHNWRLAPGHEHARVLVQPFLDHCVQRTDLVHRGIIGPKVLGTAVGCFVTTKMYSRVRGFIDVRLGPVQSCKHDIVTSV